MAVAWDELLQGQRTTRTTPRPTFTRPTKPSQAKEEGENERSPVVSRLRSYSSEAIMDSPPPIGLPPLDLESQTDDREVSHGRQALKKKTSESPVKMVTRENLSEPPSPTHFNIPEAKFRHPHAKSRDHHPRPLSMGAWNPDGFDSTLNGSSASIAVSAVVHTTESLLLKGQ